VRTDALAERATRQKRRAVQDRADDLASPVDVGDGDACRTSDDAS
jgi:hypothetical protein